MSKISNITANLQISDIKTIGGNTFINSRIMNGNPGVLLVWATWCHHCVKFKSVYQDIAARLNKSKDSFACLAIESEELKKDNGAISKILKIKGFPTMFWIAQDGKVIGQYEGDRDSKSILDQVCNVYHHCIKYHV